MVLLELSGIAKHFGAIEALKGIDLSMDAGEVVGLMGDNGAGKSTLVRIVAGNFRPSEGEIRLNGETKHFHKPVDAREQGIEVVYQDLALCDNLTAAANVFLGRELKRSFGPLKILDYPAMYVRVAELFKELKSETRPRDLVKQMSGGQRQAVAIARTRLSDARIVLMDEPTQGLAPAFIRHIRDMVSELKRAGVTVLLIEQNARVALSVCDRGYIMEKGVIVFEGPSAELRTSAVTREKLGV